MPTLPLWNFQSNARDRHSFKKKKTSKNKITTVTGDTKEHYLVLWKQARRDCDLEGDSGMLLGMLPWRSDNWAAISKGGRGAFQTEGTARENYFFSFSPSFFDSCTGLVLWPQFELDGSLYHGETNMTNLKIMASFFFFFKAAWLHNILSSGLTIFSLSSKCPKMSGGVNKD